MIFYMKNVEKPTRKYFDGRAYHKDYFETIDAQEKAYILGFLWGDGSFIPSKRTIALAIAVVDESHLRQIAACLGLDSTQIRKHKNKGFGYGDFEYVKIQMSHKIFFESLKALGYDKKRKRFRKIPAISKELMRHFVRGLMDADGCVGGGPDASTGKRKKPNLSINVPHRMAARKYVALIEAELGIKLNISPDKSIFRISIGNKLGLMKLYDYFYRDATIFLGRKKKRFDAIMEGFNPKKPPAVAMSLAA